MSDAKGSLILKSITSQEQEDEIVAYLQKYAKNIPPEEIPQLLSNLPIVLSRNVPEQVGRRVAAELRRLHAEVAFLPAPVQAAPSPSAEEKDNTQGEVGDGINGQRSMARNQLSRLYGLLPSRALARFKELLLLLSLLAIAWLLNYTVASQYLLLGFYSLPSVFAAYSFGRRHAVLTAFASILLVSLIYLINPHRFDTSDPVGLGGANQWYHLISWGCILLVTAYAMGTLYEKLQERVNELRHTYQGILFILRHFITQDEYAESHCFRVSIYAVKIATAMGLAPEHIEDIRSAALLHDLGNLQVKRNILQKAASLIQEDNNSARETSTRKDDIALPDNLRGPLKKILPMLLGQHRAYTARNRRQNEEVLPMGAAILAVADRYDELIHERFYSEPTPEWNAREVILSHAGKDFDPEVVHAFSAAFERGEMTIPDLLA